jgi:acetyl esterase/lipase
MISFPHTLYSILVAVYILSPVFVKELPLASAFLTSEVENFHRLSIGYQRFSTGYTRPHLKRERDTDDITAIVKKNDLNDLEAVDLPFFADWPKWLQNNIRDAGGIKLFLDTATRLVGAPIFYLENPWCFPEFLRISGYEYQWLVSVLRFLGAISRDKPDVLFSKETYGNDLSQVAQVMVSKDAQGSGTSSIPTFIFLHGGAWGSGFPTMYRLLSLPFLERNFRTIILGYRVFPKASIEEQVGDLVQAVGNFTERYGGAGGDYSPVVLMGHSSGAHVCMLAALDGRLPSVSALICASGVYDLEKQLKHEEILGVNEISPLKAANGLTMENLRKFSPTRKEKSLHINLPPVLLIHGGSDDTCLPDNSRDFFEVVGGGGCQLEIMDGVGHQEIVLDTCLGRNTQRVICDWIESTVKL